MAAAAASAPAPVAILQSTGAVYDVQFVSAGRLLSGGVDGDVKVWELQDRRSRCSWTAADGPLLSVHSLGGGSECLSQSKGGTLQLWDLETQASLWRADTGSCSFARALLMEPHEVSASSCCVCTPLGEPHVLGVFDVRAAGRRCELSLQRPAFQPSGAAAALQGTGSPAGMAMSLSPVPALNPSSLLAVYESTDACVWDVRSPRGPVADSVLAGDPASPAICAAVMWRQVWVSSADGTITILRLRSSGQLQRCSSTKVEAAEAPYSQEAAADLWQAEKAGVNLLAVRPDLRLVAGARWDRRVELFDVKTARSLGRLRCHDGGVLGCAFDRERGALATAGEDGRIALWGVLSETYAGPAAAARHDAAASAEGGG